MRLLTIIVLASTVSGGCVATISSAPEAASPQAHTVHRSGMIRGVIQNEHGWELSNIAVLAISNDGTGSRMGYSDRQGIYQIDDLAPGSYTLRVRRGSALVLEQTVRVAGGSSREVHLRVPAVFGDRPDQRERPIVDRSLIRSSRIRGR
tara:strand:+ start:30955 stop:31401 length:447 start_codon:yes stop_codon:yes gene_type:complete